jgi:hypothetical protein
MTSEESSRPILDEESAVHLAAAVLERAIWDARLNSTCHRSRARMWLKSEHARPFLEAFHLNPAEVARWIDAGCPARRDP